MPNENPVGRVGSTPGIVLSPGIELPRSPVPPKKSKPSLPGVTVTSDTTHPTELSEHQIKLQKKLEKHMDHFFDEHVHPRDVDDDLRSLTLREKLTAEKRPLMVMQLTSLFKELSTGKEPGSIEAASARTLEEMGTLGCSPEEMASVKQDFDEIKELFGKLGKVFTLEDKPIVAKPQIRRDAVRRDEPLADIVPGKLAKAVHATETSVEIFNRIERLGRNLLRTLAAITKAAKHERAFESIGVLNLLGAFLETGNMLKALVMVFMPNRTREQRVASLLDAMRYGMDALDQLSIGLDAILSFMKAHPKIAAVSVIFSYFAFASVSASILKCSFDLYFFSVLRAEITADMNADKDYGRIKQEWNDRINNYHVVISKLVRIAEPEFLDVLEDLDTHLQKHLKIDDIDVTTKSIDELPDGFDSEDYAEIKTLTDNQNVQVRYALLGRVNDRIFSRSVQLVSSVVDLAATTLIVTSPATGGAGVIAGGVLMSVTSVSGFAAWEQNRISKNYFKDRIVNAINGVEAVDAPYALTMPHEAIKRVAQNRFRLMGESFRRRFGSAPVVETPPAA